MGEGSGVLVLEELEHAQKRGATILAEVVGYGATCDAYHMTSPNPDGSGAGECMIQAMTEAGITPEQVDYINAHGTSTPTNDGAETTAIKYAMKEAAHTVAISSTKSMTGHLLGAAGAYWKLMACIGALNDSIIPPTIGLTEPDELCDLNYTAQKPVSRAVQYALSNSLGFGGHNAVLCFKKWGGA